MSRNTRLIICEIYIQRTILYVTLYVVCKFYVSQYAKGTQAIYCEMANNSCELDLS